MGKILTRTPQLLSCALLYACMGMPLFFTANAGALLNNSIAVKLCVILTWLGFIGGALGDFTKTIVKGRAEDSENKLVTEGIFKFLRHPNYSGEQLGWSANFVAALSAILTVVRQGNVTSVYGSKIKITAGLGMSLLGLVGIMFVLMRATTVLEQRQKEKYGENKSYGDW
eukprot:CAMPEP_0113940630 /NCGR_PEP_ID=MMETSP1339-20121228/6725_1 /TAXON_ID=94617 /ORGANISM="Fibrocapsa japonica" /LENGTH=169 /DNA_ID=CAMNT_0000944525 /DNA_START=301 /DNA_END=807 /DNA_ORIENTATION=+ /assembly_acc=CAM_ASM_000762